MGINGETLQLHAGIGSIIYGAVYKKPLFFTTSHARICIWYYKSCVLCQSEQAMKLKVSMSCTERYRQQQTRDISGVALYCGDTYIMY